MDQPPRRRDFSLPYLFHSVFYGQGNSVAGGELYIPRFNYDGMGDMISDFCLSGRTEAGEHWPKEVADCLDRLASVAGHVQLAEDENDERIGVENALSKLREAQAAFEEHGLPEPKLLTLLQVDLTRVRNELDPGQSPDRPR
jgi:hypothetical protein